MAKVISYKIVAAEVNHGTAEKQDIELITHPKRIPCATQADYDANYPTAEKEAIPGTIEVTGKFDYPTAPHNIAEGECVTIGGVLYKATENIPSGEPIIIGQNAVVTTIEEQLAELAKGE